MDDDQPYVPRQQDTPGDQCDPTRLLSQREVGELRERFQALADECLKKSALQFLRIVAAHGTQVRPPTDPLPQRPARWLTIWNLFRFILPGDVQEKVFWPALTHLLKDYVRRLEYTGKWARAWIQFAFFVRTVLLVLDCLRAMLTHRACTFFKELFLGK